MSKNHVMVAAWAAAIASIAIAVVHHVGRSLAAPEGWLACTAFAAPIAAAAVLALIGVYTDRPPLWLTAGVALAISSFIWPLAIPLLVPAVVMICTESDRFDFGVPAALAGILTAMFGYMAFQEGPIPTFGGEGETSQLFANQQLAYLMLIGAAIVALLGAIWAITTDPAERTDVAASV